LLQTIVEQGGDYLLPVKDNQPTLRANLETWFHFASPEQSAHIVSKGHGRITRYDLETTTRPTAGLGWPGLQAGIPMTRTTIDPRTGAFTRSNCLRHHLIVTETSLPLPTPVPGSSALDD